MLLATPHQSITAKLSSSPATMPDFMSSSTAYAGYQTSGFKAKHGALDGTNRVQVVENPSSDGEVRRCNSLMIANRHSAAVTVTVEYKDGTTYRVLCEIEVGVDQTLQWNGVEWSLFPEEHSSLVVADLETTGALVVGTTLNVGTDATIGDDLTVTDDCQIGDALVVGGVSTLTGAVGCSSTLDVTGVLTASSDLDVQGDLHIAAFGVVSQIGAKGDFFVGTANDTLGVLSVGANETCVVADSGQSTGLKYANRSRALSVATGTGSTNASSASESSDLISYTFTAGYFNTAGKTVRVTIWGKCGTTGTPTLNVRNKLNDTLGAQTIGSPSATSPGTGVSDRLVFTQLLITTNTTGSSGRLYCMALQGHGTSIGANHGGVAADYLTLNLNNAITVSQTSQWSVSSSSNTHTPLAIIVEELN